MAKTKGKSNTRRKTVSKKVDQIADTIRREVIGLGAIGLACLGVVSLYSDKVGFVGEKIKYILTTLAGGGRLWLLLLLALWGLSYMNRRQQNNWRKLGFVLLWLVLVGVLHLQLPGIEVLENEELIAQGKAGRGGGLIGAFIAVALKGAVGIAGSYVILIVLAMIGALLVTNWSLIEGLREAKKVSYKTGEWVSGQVKDFVTVLNNRQQSGTPDLGQELKKESEQ